MNELRTTAKSFKTTAQKNCHSGNSKKGSIRSKHVLKNHDRQSVKQFEKVLLSNDLVGVSKSVEKMTASLRLQLLLFILLSFCLFGYIVRMSMSGLWKFGESVGYVNRAEDTLLATPFQMIRSKKDCKFYRKHVPAALLLELPAVHALMLLTWLV
mmetsp:Transcript_10320/g.11854  ORF Transcript_10320/g.11854 Transcript_10320/m.11854 type:complete len:155 (+) Transcript_10320:762-1226(+)